MIAIGVATELVLKMQADTDQRVNAEAPADLAAATAQASSDQHNDHDTNRAATR